MRLIDADVLNDTVEKSIAKFGEVFSEDLITGLKACVYIAMQQPTIVQPEIIHCKDCYYRYGRYCHYRYTNGLFISADHYCGFAKRQEDDK